MKPFLLVVLVNITALFSSGLETPGMAPYIKTPITIQERADRLDYDRRRGLYTECAGYDGDWTKGGLPEIGNCVNGVWIPPGEEVKSIPKCGQPIPIVPGKWYSRPSDIAPIYRHQNSNIPKGTVIPNPGGHTIDPTWFIDPGVPGNIPTDPHLPGDFCDDTDPSIPVSSGNTLVHIILGLFTILLIRRTSNDN